MAATILQWDAGAALMPAAGAPGAAFTTGTNFTWMSLNFDQTTVETVFFFGVVPQNYAGGTITIRIFWTAATTGNVVWFANYLGRVDDEVLDTALSTGSQVTDGVTAANDIMVASFTVSTPALVAGDWFVLNVGRLANDGSDTLAADAKLLAVEIQE